jgi:hypothetical protein
MMNSGPAEPGEAENKNIENNPMQSRKWAAGSSNKVTSYRLSCELSCSLLPYERRCSPTMPQAAIAAISSEISTL